MPQHRRWRGGCQGSYHSNQQQKRDRQVQLAQQEEKKDHYLKIQQLYLRLALLPNAEQMPRYDPVNPLTIQDTVRNICQEINEILQALDELGEKFINQACIFTLILSKLPKLFCKARLHEFYGCSIENRVFDLWEDIKCLAEDDNTLKSEYMANDIRSTTPYRGHLKVQQCYTDVKQQFLEGRDYWFPMTTTTTSEMQTEAVIKPTVDSINQQPNQAVLASTKPLMKEQKKQRQEILPTAKGRNPPKPCAFCNEAHFNAHCPIYTTPRKRRTALVQQKRCFRCFSQGHVIDDCKKPDRICHNCGKVGHHRLLCSNPTQPNLASKSVKEKLGYQVKINNLVKAMMSLILESQKTGSLKINSRQKIQEKRNLARNPD